MADNYVQKSVSLYRDAKNNLYWLFPNNTIERGFYILGLPAKKFDAECDLWRCDAGSESPI